ncbi:MAG: EAL domain-containing protein [Chloroflexota bacterium]
MHQILSWAGVGRGPLSPEQTASLVERDRLTVFWPWLLRLSALFACASLGAGWGLQDVALVVVGWLNVAFTGALLVSAWLARRGRLLDARLVAAVAVTSIGLVGSYLVPDVHRGITLLPILSVVLVLPAVSRSRTIPVVGLAAAAGLVTPLLGALPKTLPPIQGALGMAYPWVILITITAIIVVAIVDYANEARDAQSRLVEAGRLRDRSNAERIAIIASRALHAQSTPEATAGLIADALLKLPVVEIAALFEPHGAGLRALAVRTDDLEFPIKVGDRLNPSRAEYLLGRAANGAWAEDWKPPRDPSDHTMRLTELGTKGCAYAPIMNQGEIVGLIVTSTTDASQAAHMIADLPAVREFAALAETILAPALVSRRNDAAVRERISTTIAAEAFRPVYQPLVDLDSGTTMGYEALTRFDDGSPPDQMFASALACGLGNELEIATLRVAIRSARTLPRGSWLSLNVSPGLMTEFSTLERLIAGATCLIVLEVTEHEEIDDYAAIREARARLGSATRLAVDDAGAGAANFRHLVELQPDFVKVDVSLVRGVDTDVRRQAVIVGLVHFAEAARCEVIAEGIESSAELAMVRKLGVHLGQGYLLGRPSPVEIWEDRGHQLRRGRDRPSSVLPVGAA